MTVLLRWSIFWFDLLWRDMKPARVIFPNSKNRWQNSPCRSSGDFLYFCTCRGASFNVTIVEKWVNDLTFVLRIRPACFWRHKLVFPWYLHLQLNSCIPVCPQQKLNHKANWCHSAQENWQLSQVAPKMSSHTRWHGFTKLNQRTFQGSSKSWWSASVSSWNLKNWIKSSRSNKVYEF